MDPDNIAALTASPYPEAEPQQTSMPPREDVDEFLRKKRKAREHKACYPCRQRKVKYVSLLKDRICESQPRSKRKNGEILIIYQVRPHTPMQDMPGARAPRALLIQSAKQATEHRRK